MAVLFQSYRNAVGDTLVVHLT